MQKDFHFVIIGSGNISKTYFAAVDNLPGVKIAAIVSRQLNRPDYLDQSVDIQVAASLSEVQKDFDAVILTTPNGLHHKGAIEAAEMGKHVLTEKPLDISIENMDLMIETCRQCNVKLGVSYQRRMSPDNMIIKELLADNKLGQVYAADLAVKFYRDQAYYDSGDYRGGKTIDGGGPFMQQASHNLDTWCWFFGLPYKVNSLLGTFDHDIEVEDHGAALLSYKNGMIGTIITSTACWPGFPARLEIHTAKGSVIMENDIITQWHMRGLPNPSASADFTVHSGADSAAVADTSGHEAIISDFVSAVKEDRPPAVSGESARKATELILQIYGNFSG